MAPLPCTCLQNGNLRSSRATALQQNLWGETAQSLGRKPDTTRGGVTPCFLFRYRDILAEKKTDFVNAVDEAVLILETVVRLRSVDLKPLRIVLYSLTTAGRFVSTDYTLTDPSL